MKVKIELTQKDIELALKNYIGCKLNIDLSERSGFELRIEVKSKQNYKSEWEEADFRATVTSK